MIKKLYAILFALSLLAALPALGMQKDQQATQNQQNTTYSCDCCGKTDLDVLRMKHQHSWHVHCYHFFCEACWNPLSAFEFDHIKMESPDCWWDCSYCSYLLPIKQNIHAITDSSFGIGYHGSGGCRFEQKDGDITTQIKDYFKAYKQPLPTLMTTLPSKPILLKLLEPKWFIPISMVIIAVAGSICEWYKGKDAQEGDKNETAAQKEEIDGTTDGKQEVKDEAKPTEQV